MAAKKRGTSRETSPGAGDGPAVTKPRARAGERNVTVLWKGEDRLSFAVSPAGKGFAVRTRRKGNKKVAVESCVSAEAADARVAELVKLANTKGWGDRSRAKAEDLFAE